MDIITGMVLIVVGIVAGALFGYILSEWYFNSKNK